MECQGGGKLDGASWILVALLAASDACTYRRWCHRPTILIYITPNALFIIEAK